MPENIVIGRGRTDNEFGPQSTEAAELFGLWAQEPAAGGDLHRRRALPEARP